VETSTPLFTIDENLCRRDGLCAAACPASLVRQDGPDELP
jgi:ferredoxin